MGFGRNQEGLAAAMMAGMMAEGMASDRPYDKSKFNADADKLRGMCDAINHQSPLAVGDIVVWKTGLKNKKFPAYGQPVVVTRRLSDALVANTTESGTPYFNEPLNIAIGFIDPDGDFSEFHMDARRFEKVG